MDAEAEAKLTQDEDKDESEPPSPEKQPLSSEEPNPPSDSNTSEVPMRPPIESELTVESTNSGTAVRYSAATLPLPDRPQSTFSESNEGIYDQLPATLNRKPQKAPAPLVPPVTEEPDHERVQEKEKEIKEIEAEKKYDDINTHRVCAIVTMVLCSFILNIFAFSCLIPAFFFSSKSKESLQGEDLPSAEKYARRSLILILVAVIVTFLVLLGVFIVLQIAFAAGGLY